MPENRLNDTESIDHYSLYLDQNLSKGVNSRTVINHLSEIHRVIFNYCDARDNVSRAQRLGVCDVLHTPQTLLDMALMSVMGDG